MEGRRSTRRRLAVNPILLGQRRASATVLASSSQQIQESFDFDYLHDLSTDDVQFILDHKSHYESDFHRQISDKIAIHGVKVYL